MEAAYNANSPRDIAVFCGEIAAAWACTGDRKMSLQVVADAFNVASGIDDPTQRVDAMCSVAVAQASLGNIEQGRRILASTTVFVREINGEKFPGDFLKKSFGRIAAAYAVMGRTPQVIRLAQEFAICAPKSVGDFVLQSGRDEILEKAAVAQAEMGKISEALSILQESDLISPDAYCAIAIAQAQAGDIAELSGNR